MCYLDLDQTHVLPHPILLQGNEEFAGSVCFPSRGVEHVSSTPERKRQLNMFLVFATVKLAFFTSWRGIFSHILCLNALCPADNGIRCLIICVNCESLLFFPLFWLLPYLSSQMLTGYHPLLTNGDPRSQVLPHRYERLLKNFKTAQLSLHVPSQGSTFCTNKHKKIRWQTWHRSNHTEWLTNKTPSYTCKTILQPCQTTCHILDKGHAVIVDW